jgi:hypothetical protein
MARRVQAAVLAAALVALGGCGEKAAPEPAAREPATTQRTTPAAPGAPTDPPADRTPAPQNEPDPQDLLSLLVPKGVPTEANGRRADPKDLAVVKRWLAALTQGDVDAAADTFADGTVVQNLQPPMRLPDRAARVAFNEQFPCGAEIVDASSIKGYLVVTYRLTDRVDSPCDGPGGKAAGTIKVEGAKMTEWYRLPDPPQEPEAPAGPAV